MVKIDQPERRRAHNRVYLSSNQAHGGNLPKSEWNKPHPKSGFNKEAYNQRRSRNNETSNANASAEHFLNLDPHLAKITTAGLRGRVIENKSIAPEDIKSAGSNEQRFAQAMLSQTLTEAKVHRDYEILMSEIYNDHVDNDLLRETNVSRVILQNRKNFNDVDLHLDAELHRIDRVVKNYAAFNNLQRCEDIREAESIKRIGEAENEVYAEKLKLESKVRLEEEHLRAHANDFVNDLCEETAEYSRQVKEIKLRARFLKETREERHFIALSEFEENDLRENGPKKDLSPSIKLIKFSVIDLPSDEADQKFVIYPKTSENLPFQTRVQLTLPLVPMLFFYREESESWSRWIIRQILKPFYCQFTVQDVQQVAAEYLDAEHRMIWYPEGAVGTMVQFHSVGKHFDKTTTTSLLKNFRFLGFEWEVIRNVFLSKNDFFVRNNLNRYNIQMVHPIIYQQALKTALGKTITQVLVDQVLSDMKGWCDMVPSDLVVSSINCGCQMAQALMSVKNSAFAKVDIIAKTA